MGESRKSGNQYQDTTGSGDQDRGDLRNSKNFFDYLVLLR
jgi:hypothetical protein